MNELIHAILSGAIGAIGAIVPTGLFVWLFKTWIGKKIEASIRHAYEKRTEDYKNELAVRDRAQLAAELLAEWMSTPVDKPFNSEQRKKMNRLSFEATLWLPEDIAVELGAVLQQRPEAPNKFDVLLRVREHLSGSHSLTINDITQWSRYDELPNKGLPEGIVLGQICARSVIEELDGAEQEISESMLINGHCPAPGSILRLVFTKNGDAVEIKRNDIQKLQMISKGDVEGHLKGFQISLTPREVANDINRILFEENGFFPQKIDDTKKN